MKSIATKRFMQKKSYLGGISTKWALVENGASRDWPFHLHTILHQRNAQTWWHVMILLGKINNIFQIKLSVMNQFFDQMMNLPAQVRPLTIKILSQKPPQIAQQWQPALKNNKMRVWSTKEHIKGIFRTGANKPVTWSHSHNRILAFWTPGIDAGLNPSALSNAWCVHLEMAWYISTRSFI